MSVPLACAFAIALALSTAGASNTAVDAELTAKLADLERHFRQNHEEIKSLEELKPRRLMLDCKKSIFSNTTDCDSYSRTQSFQGALTHAWLILCGSLVLIMQAGFAVLQAGSCRKKCIENILLNCIADVSIGTWGWWALGWSFAYSGPWDENGNSKGGFAGKEQFLGHHFLQERPDGTQEPTTAMVNWFFRWGFACVAATIVGAGAAERMKFPGYVVYSFLLTSFIYPCVVHWTWGYGWLSDFNRTGFMDFSGSGIVHMTGGIGALCAAIIAGPRPNRFKAARFKTEPPLAGGEVDEFAPHSTSLVVLGTFIIWFGWYGFNCGSTMSMDSIEMGFKAAQVAMNTTLAAVGGGVTSLAIKFVLTRKVHILSLCNGILAGLVSISAPCSNIECGTALGVGMGGALLYQVSSHLISLLKVDDPLDTFSVYAMCGGWGLFSAAVFDWGKGFSTFHGWSGFKCYLASDGNCKGLRDSLGKSAVSANVVEIVFISMWVTSLSLLIFIPLKLSGQLVASIEEQQSSYAYSKKSNMLKSTSTNSLNYHWDDGRVGGTGPK